MRLGFACALACASSGGACAALNPAYGDDDDAASGNAGATGGAQTSTGAVPGTTSDGDGDGDDGSDGGQAIDLGTQGGCGDGQLDAGEDCDDGNVENEDDCLDDCTLPPAVEWTRELDVEPGIRQRFNALDVADGVVVAGGRGALDGVETPVLRSFLEDGAPGGLQFAPLTQGAGAEIRSVAFATDGQLYFAGRSANAGQVAVVGTTSVAPDGAFGGITATSVAGSSRAQGLAIGRNRVAVGIGEFNDDGYGLGACTFTLECQGSPMLAPNSQLDDLLLVDDVLMAVGFLDSYPAVATAAMPATESLVPVFMGDIPGRLQGLAVNGDLLFVAGTRDMDLGDDDDVAWLVALDRDTFEMRWEDEVTSESLDDDEFEDVAATPEGNVVVVGMLGVPPAPVVREYDRGGGVRWTMRLGPHAEFAAGSARAVAVRDEAIYVAGEWGSAPLGQAGDSSVGFVVKLAR